MSTTAPGFAHLPGTRVPGRPFTITADEDAQLRAIVGDDGPDADADAGEAHPLWGLVLSRRTIALDLHALLALADFPVEDGPLLGSFDLTLDVPLRVGREYGTTIVVAAIERKAGRRTGTFDLMDVVHEYLDGVGGPVVGRYVQQYVLPRRGA